MPYGSPLHGESSLRPDARDSQPVGRRVGNLCDDESCEFHGVMFCAALAPTAGHRLRSFQPRRCPDSPGRGPAGAAKQAGRSESQGRDCRRRPLTPEWWSLLSSSASRRSSGTNRRREGYRQRVRRLRVCRCRDRIVHSTGQPRRAGGLTESRGCCFHQPADRRPLSDRAGRSSMRRVRGDLQLLDLDRATLVSNPLGAFTT